MVAERSKNSPASAGEHSAADAAIHPDKEH
jgi:hypothetical protein